MRGAERARLHGGMADEAEAGEQGAAEDCGRSPASPAPGRDPRDERGGEEETRLPDGSEGGVREDVAQGFGIESRAPRFRHRRGLDREPADGAERRDDAERRDKTPNARRERRFKRLGRVEPQERAGAERQHQAEEMRGAAYRKRGQHRWSARSRASPIAITSSSRPCRPHRQGLARRCRARRNRPRSRRHGRRSASP